MKKVAKAFIIKSGENAILEIQPQFKGKEYVHLTRFEAIKLRNELNRFINGEMLEPEREQEVLQEEE